MESTLQTNHASVESVGDGHRPHGDGMADDENDQNDDESPTLQSQNNNFMPSAQFCANTDLSSVEKQLKKRGKRHLKQQKRIRKYEVRWSQATGRHDAPVAERARNELRDYLVALRDEADSLWYQEDFPKDYHEFLQDQSGRVQVPTILSSSTGSGGGNVPTSTKEEDEATAAMSVTQGRTWMTREIWQKLVSRMLPNSGGATTTTTTDKESCHSSGNVDCNGNPNDDDDDDDDENINCQSRKQTQTIQARTLLRHMTKGTQTENMFDNDAALIGYTRQKFMERAILALKSLERLRPLLSPSYSHPQQHQEEAALYLWESLLRVKSIVSIGCGPGCDAVGILTFIRMQQLQQQAEGEEEHRPLLDRILFMDYVMPRWKRLVLDHLIPLLAVTGDSSSVTGSKNAWVSRVDTASCDVRYSLTNDERNRDAWTCLGCGDDDNAGDVRPKSVDLIVVSYLLTETRDQWTDFFRELLHKCPGCLLLLSEPTAWQLHSFLSLFADSIQHYQWLDSSRDSPKLQPLEGRMGPAVLLIQTKRA